MPATKGQNIHLNFPLSLSRAAGISEEKGKKKKKEGRHVTRAKEGLRLQGGTTQVIKMLTAAPDFSMTPQTCRERKQMLLDGDGLGLTATPTRRVNNARVPTAKKLNAGPRNEVADPHGGLFSITPVESHPDLQRVTLKPSKRVKLPVFFFFCLFLLLSRLRRLLMPVNIQCLASIWVSLPPARPLCPQLRAAKQSETPQMTIPECLT